MSIQLQNLSEPEALAKEIVERYDSYNSQRKPWKDESLEIRNYVFATDNASIGGRALPWSNTTHVPKITQIYDNLKSNYISALFPNDDWLNWLAGDQEAANLSKRKAILSYMQNKLRESNFRSTVGQLLDDYVLYGNAFADVEFVKEATTDPNTGETIPGYIGPRVLRLSPYDIVMNPLAKDFSSSIKITRSVVSLGELKGMILQSPDNQGWAKETLSKLDNIRHEASVTSADDFEVVEGLQVDGFGSFYEYLNSGYVELITMEGDMYDMQTGKLEQNMIITVADRVEVVRRMQNPSWMGKSYKQHVGWRDRPDNLWGMSPLANVIGLQYRINALENGKADAIDLNILPPMEVRGEVDNDINWGPGEVIHTDENGSVRLLSPNLSALNVSAEIQNLMNQMEQFTGAPSEAMGLRTPGEKTAFEVNSLMTAAGRIFQEKITKFEIELLEPLLNSMLEIAARNVDGSDLIRVMDDDIGVETFLQITKEDITAAGKLRAVGARHFSRQSQILQNLTGIANSGVWPLIQNHVSRKQLAKLSEELLGLSRYDLFSENIGIVEDSESAQMAQQMQQSQEQPAEGPQGNVIGMV